MKRSEQFQQLRALTDAVIEQQASEEEVAELKKILADDEDAQAFYFEYIELHTRLKASAERNIEFVYRRMTEEELIMRPVNAAKSSSVDVQHRAQQLAQESDSLKHKLDSRAVEPESIVETSSENSGTQHPTQVKKWKSPLGISILLLCLVAITFTVIHWSQRQSANEAFNAILFSGKLNAGNFAQIKGTQLLAGDYQVKHQASIGLHTGETLNLVEDSQFTLFSNNKISLHHGALSLVPVPNNSIEITSPSFTLYSNGSELEVDLRHEQPIIKTGKQTLISPKSWRPKHFWTFDGSTDRAFDSAGDADGIVYPGATRTAGIVGQGAFAFDNSPDTRLNLGNGGGKALGTGSFAANDGVTIEALIKPNYSGQLGESDHIFRKGQSDGLLRILLSFQNDRGKDYLRPKGEFAESISFGLFILGQGYHELKLPLDGRDGRPTLAELNNGDYHHIVATYNASTGLKAIYINGQQLASYQYPASAKMLSGGAGQANIGNSPTFPRAKDHHAKVSVDTTGQVELPPQGIIDVHSAAYHGVIDEVAFYDFSLSPLVIKQHYQEIQLGRNYFGLIPSNLPLPENVKLKLPADVSISLSKQSGQPIEVVNLEKE